MKLWRLSLPVADHPVVGHVRQPYLQSRLMVWPPTALVTDVGPVLFGHTGILWAQAEDVLRFAVLHCAGDPQISTGDYWQVALAGCYVKQPVFLILHLCHEFL